ncbi:hypothetical protein OSB04_022103 [Centaurea solstitialis]|uniref:Transmembrane protein n=1 Tax=Centaurea solstitialis TaxID=347529 RepID=A0AA38WEU0_9ASTR|nr:hypothetical protein OSB04_022103 [Centaurea solstitialis]
MADDTTALSYWLNWRFFLCALWILIAMIAATVLIIKYEVFNKKTSRIKDREHDVEPIGILYEDETWRTSLKALHPAWLLVYRLIAFGVMLALLIASLILNKADIFFFYTEWTFALVTFYFGLASSFSIYGCYRYRNGAGDGNINRAILDTERGTYVAPSEGESETHVRETAGMWGYFFQIVFQNSVSIGVIFIALSLKSFLTLSLISQISAGAVGLTDSVFWFIIYPFLTPASYSLNFNRIGVGSYTLIPSFLLCHFEGTFVLSNTVGCYHAFCQRHSPSCRCGSESPGKLHLPKFYPISITVHLCYLTRFPFFRLAYFGLWTCVFVIFQWILHACVDMWWPYSFLDLSSPLAPIWYLGVGLIHLPAFGIFALIVRGKQLLLSRFSGRNEA